MKPRRLIWNAGATVALVVVAAAAQRPSDPAIVQGYNLLHQGERDAAIRHFIAHSTAHPAYLGAQLARALAEIDRQSLDPSGAPEFARRLDALIDAASRRHRANAGDADALFHLAQAHMLRATYRFEQDQGMWGAARDGANAKSYSETYLKQHPNDADAYLTLGLYNYFVDVIPAAYKLLRFLLFLPAGDRPEGLRQIERAHAGGGIFAFRAGQVLIEIYSTLEGRPNDALALAERRHRDFPANDDVTMALAALVAGPSFEDRQRAAGLYQEVITRRAAANTLDATKSGPDAIDAMESRHRAMLALAGVRFDEWRIREAIDLLTSAIDRAPQAPDWILPTFLLRRGNYRALLDEPGADADAQRVLKDARLKKWHSGATEQVTWITERRQSGEARIYAALVAGNRLAAEARWDEARRFYEQAAAGAPRDPQVRFRLGHLEFLRGQTAAAAAVLQPLATERGVPDWIRAAAWLDVARAHDLAGRRDEAVRIYQRIVDDYESQRPAQAARIGLFAPYRRPARTAG
jgi:tetratricopeptide (TPR) repeat protein